MKNLRAALICSLALQSLVALGQVVPEGLEASYQFNGNLEDASGNGLHLNPGGVFAYTADRFGNLNSAVQLITAADHGTFFSGMGPDLASSSSSVTFWVRKDYIGNGANGTWVFGLGHPIGVGGALNEDMSVALDYGSSIRYSFFYNDLDSETPLQPGEWYHLAFTFDSEAQVRTIYIDGVVDLTDTFAGMFVGDTNLKMGFPGLTLDDFRFYSRALSAAEVSALHAIPEPATATAWLALFTLATGILYRRRLIGKST